MCFCALVVKCFFEGYLMLCNLVELFVVCLKSEWLIGGTAKYVGYVLIKGKLL